VRPGVGRAGLAGKTESARSDRQRDRTRRHEREGGQVKPGRDAAGVSAKGAVAPGREPVVRPGVGIMVGLGKAMSSVMLGDGSLSSRRKPARPGLRIAIVGWGWPGPEE